MGYLKIENERYHNRKICGLLDNNQMVVIPKGPGYKSMTLFSVHTTK